MNRLILVAIVLVIMAIWFSALANACSPRVAGSYWGPSWGPPIFIGGGWDRGGFGGSGSGSSSSPSAGRSSGGSATRGGGISGGIGGK